MKTLIVAAFVALLAAGSSMAGTRVFVNFGGYGGYGGYGCAPRYYARPVSYAPRVVSSYCASPVAYSYYQAAPIYYYTSAPVVYAAPLAPVIYRAPVVAAPVSVSTVSFGWRH